GRMLSMLTAADGNVRWRSGAAVRPSMPPRTHVHHDYARLKTLSECAGQIPASRFGARCKCWRAVGIDK
ncbi:MAG: hypothetical protein ABI305_08360, partial [Tepidiformaceae bacterium]